MTEFQYDIRNFDGSYLKLLQYQKSYKTWGHYPVNCLKSAVQYALKALSNSFEKLLSTGRID